MEYKITIAWDGEAHVWFAESDDIPGLILKSGSVDALIERVKVAALELLEISGIPPTNIHLLFKMEREAVVA
ncbi:antitoxin HicB [Spirochaetia bacterium]|nr:antitoxin HicB [Spirochaetia bacterium]